jgi:hypothetical protein
MTPVPNNYRRLEGSERRPTRGAKRTAAADPNEKLSFTIRLRRRPSAPPAPDQHYWAQISPGQRKYLSCERARPLNPSVREVKTVRHGSQSTQMRCKA